MEMRIAITEQESTDFDWFGVDADGFVAHFASGAFKYLPRSVERSAEDLKLVTDFFGRATSRGGHSVDPVVSTEVPDWQGEEKEGRYLRSFVTMADKGLFSFDIGPQAEPGIAYFRVAAPEHPIKIGHLPENIRKVIARTSLTGVRLREQDKIPYEATLSL